MKFSKFFDTINSLKKTSEIHPSINVRAKIIFYLNEQILNTYYLGMFYIYCQNGIYEVNEEFRNMINAIIKKSGKLPMYWLKNVMSRYPYKGNDQYPYKGVHHYPYMGIKRRGQEIGKNNVK